MTDRRPAPSRPAHYGDGLLILALMLAYTVLAATSLSHPDLARDMRTALDIRDGVAYPLLGPPLGNHVHLGSGWYYLLALLQALGGGWLGAMLLLALLASLQFPFAYLAGRAWSGRGAGLLWACLLLLPSWSTFEQVFPTHTQLSGTLAAALLYCALRHYRGGGPGWLAGMALATSLAIHAHPTAVALAGVPIAALLRGWRRGQLRPGTLALLAGAAALPFLPLLVDQLLHGPTLLHGLGGYYASGNVEHVSPAHAPPIAWQLAGGGLRYWLTAVLGLPGTAGWAAGLAVAALTLAGLAGAASAAIRGDRLPGLALLLLPLGLLVLVSMRWYFPFWMITALRVALLGVVAVGLVELGRAVPGRRALGIAVALACLAAYAAVAMTAVRWQRQGAWPFAVLPVIDIKNAWEPRRPLALMPAYGMAASGRWLCDAGPLAVHGAYATHLVHDYALEARLACGGGDLVAGGGEAGRAHWLGLSRAMLERLEIAAPARVGPFGLLPARRVPEGRAALDGLDRAGFPATAGSPGPERMVTLRLAMGEGERLAITNLDLSFANEPAIRVRAGGRELEPAAADWMTRVYPGVPGGGEWEVEIRAGAPELVDLAVF